MKNFIRSLVPQPVLGFYHLSLAYLGTLWYSFPSRKLTVIAVTGTKGKSTVTELVANLLRGAEKKVVSASTIQFCIGDECEPNLYKMSTPGRFFMQRFLRRAVSAGCTHAVIELTSEAAAQYRHKGIALNALVFTNLSPEHIESHGSFERYADAKLSIARALGASRKRPRIIVANADDIWSEKFLDTPAEVKATFALKDAEPYNTDDKSIRFVWRGKLFSVPLPGLFNLKNCLAALTLGEALGLSVDSMHKTLEHIGPIAGRAQRIAAGQPFDVVVDYAHTADSLRALFETFKEKQIIAVFGATGGGRDTWKRPAMGKVADEFCVAAYLTDDDSYDEDPRTIAQAVASGFSRIKPVIETDRRKAIALALAQAKAGDAVLIAGKGTDPYLMGPRGTKQPWSDSRVVSEELAKLGYN
jgi:UDP-N-acetylmuramoyl-L-alanyl-D-glutamate--2,6-diaminopimelate ligase